MWINRLNLTNFRNFKGKELVLGQKTSVIVGPNAAGKTNLLEAIYLTSSGESFRAEKIEEMVSWGEEVGHVESHILSDNDKTKLQVILTRGEVQGQKTAKRSYKINGVPRRKLDFAGKLTAVVFRPEDLELVTDSPTTRRAFMNAVLGQVDREYRRSLISYEKGLRRRNKLLVQIREGEVPRTVLTFWDMLLIKEGEILTRKRMELVEFINSQPLIEQSRRLIYDKSLISPKRLAQYEKEEIAAGYTLVGPHRDDWLIETHVAPNQWMDIAKYGSRGQQRMAILWLKLSELSFVEDKAGERPMLLLDDIFSELDEKHDRLVMSLLGRQQTVITATEVEERIAKMSDLEIWRLG